MTDAPVHFVIGATGGIGRELCHRLAKDGSHLVLMGRDESSVKQLAGDVGGIGLVGDATDWDRVADAVKQTLQQHGRISGAANLAGSVLLKPAHLTSFEDYQQTIAQNLTTAMGLVKFVAPAMRKTGGGNIVLMSSAASDIGLSNHECIAAAKAGVTALAKSAAATYASAGIRINAVSPGLVQTQLTEKVWGSERAAQASAAMHPLGRLGQPSDIASLVAWLLHPDQTWITAQDIAVDGGLSTIKPTR